MFSPALYASGLPAGPSPSLSPSVPRGAEPTAEEVEEWGMRAEAEARGMGAQSNLLAWSSRAFRKPLLHPWKSSDDALTESGARRLWRLERACQASRSARGLGAARKLDQTLVQDTGQEMNTLLNFHPFAPSLVVADARDNVSVWNVDETECVTRLRNGNREGRITSMAWLNPHLQSLLLLGSDDGVARLWRGAQGDEFLREPSLLTALALVPGLRPAGRGSGLITLWQQHQGTLFAGGASPALRAWDLHAERCVRTIPTKSSAGLTSLAALPAAGALVAGFTDGALHLVDARTPQALAVQSGVREHKRWVVNVAAPQGGSGYSLGTASVAGDVRLWDVRRLRRSVRAEQVQTSMLTAFAMHDHVPLIATGSHMKFIQLLDADFTSLGVIKFHDGFMGQRIGQITTLAFHPTRLLLAAGATDSIVSVYTGER